MADRIEESEPKVKITRSHDMETYRIRAGHADMEWATICILGWQAKGIDGQPRECGEILIHSSFGSWAFSWGHLGKPFKRFLVKAEREYVAGKFIGAKAYKFDGEKSVRELRQSLIERRRQGDLDKDEARVIWDWIEEREMELESSADLFVERLYDLRSEMREERSFGRGALRFLEEPYERTCTSLDRQFAGFWRDIWPAFIGQLKTELEALGSATAPEANRGVAQQGLLT